MGEHMKKGKRLSVKTPTKELRKDALSKTYSKWFSPQPGAVQSMRDPAFKQVSLLNYSETVGYSDSTATYVQ